MKYILIILIMGQFGKASTGIEFNTIDACEKAAITIQTRVPENNNVMAFCTPKGYVR